MSLPRFKLDLVTYDDPATLVPLPLAVEPSRTELTQHDAHPMDPQPALLQELQRVLAETDFGYV